MTKQVSSCCGPAPCPALDVESAVAERYSRAAHEREAALCCPVQYDPKYLAAIPAQVLERDYGCGDPSRYVEPGQTVLDLGSGGGKICFIASQVVGPRGRVLGVDINDEMLTLARRSAPEVAAQVGYGNVSFLKGRIEDLSLDVERFDRYLADHPVRSTREFAAAERERERQRRDEPLIADASIDVVVSNCVLNLVESEAKRQLFSELFRVLAPGGTAAISDITSDRPVPQGMKQDPELWSGCISGALCEEEFPRAFTGAGFARAEIAERQNDPWQVVAGIEFRSVTVIAYKDAAASKKPRTASCSKGCC